MNEKTFFENLDLLKEKLEADNFWIHYYKDDRRFFTYWLSQSITMDRQSIYSSKFYEKKYCDWWYLLKDIKNNIKCYCKKSLYRR